MNLRKRPLPTLLVFALLFFMAGCATGPRKTSKPASDWSRGVAIGENAIGVVDVLVDPNGEVIHVAWPIETEAGQRVQYVQLDLSAMPLVQRELDLGAAQIRSVHILPAKDDTLYLFWAQRRDGQRAWTLAYARLGVDGALLSEPRSLTTDEQSIGDYSLAMGVGDVITVVWNQRGKAGVFGLQLDAAGDLVTPVTLLVPAGEKVDVRSDRTGGLHLAWLEENFFYYGALLDGKLRPPASQRISDIALGTGASLVGPRLGLSDGWGYIFWSVFNRSGLEAGTAYTAYAAFPLDTPGYTPSERLGISPAEALPEAPYQGWLALSGLVPPVPPAFSSEYIYEPVVFAGQGEDLPVALTVKQTIRMDSYVQMVVAVFREGQFEGYQTAVKSRSLSIDPALVASDSGQLYLAWREGSLSEKIYFASTDPVTRTALDALDSTDIFTALLEGGMEGLVGILLLPIVGFGWMLPGGVLIGIWKIIRDYESIREAGARFILLIAVLIYQGTKVVTLPGMLNYVPFSAWLDIPAGWQDPLRLSVPALIFILALMVAEWVRRRRSESAVAYYIAWTLSDAILTLGVYGVIFLGS